MCRVVAIASSMEDRGVPKLEETVEIAASLQELSGFGLFVEGN